MKADPNMITLSFYKEILKVFCNVRVFIIEASDETEEEEEEEEEEDQQQEVLSDYLWVPVNASSRLVRSVSNLYPPSPYPKF